MGLARAWFRATSDVGPSAEQQGGGRRFASTPCGTAGFATQILE
jgi:hypothetical protein